MITTKPLTVIHGSLYFNSGGRRMKVDLERVTHISVTTEQTVIYTLGRHYSTGYQLIDICSMLPPDQFFRVHPLHIVALRHVHMLDGKEVLVGGDRLFTTHFYRLRLAEAMDRRKVIPLVSYKTRHRDVLL
jgi:hypothetical protein